MSFLIKQHKIIHKPPLHLCSSGIELMNAAALLLLLLLNLLLVGRQERLKRSEMVWRLKGIISQLSGKLCLLTNAWKHENRGHVSSERGSLSICFTLTLVPTQDQVSGWSLSVDKMT